MDLEMVFNELSLQVPANDIQMAKQRMSELILTAREAAELGVKPIIRTHHEFYNPLLADNYSLSNWLVDQFASKNDWCRSLAASFFYRIRAWQNHHWVHRAKNTIGQYLITPTDCFKPSFLERLRSLGVEPEV